MPAAVASPVSACRRRSGDAPRCCARIPTTSRLVPQAIAVRRSTSVETKNCQMTRPASTSPTGTGRRCWVTTSSSSAATISGGTTSMPTTRCAWLRFISTKGENPKSRPPTNAAGCQVTQRRSSRNMARALSAGDSVRATFSEATDPASAVSGLSGMPRPSWVAPSRTLTPCGCHINEVHSGETPWPTAWAAKPMNHREYAGSPHPHREVEDGSALQMLAKTRRASRR